jgi:hypothetical protein
MRPVLVALTIFGALAVVDLLTGSPIGDRTFDALLLAGCALGLWGFLEMRWVANRIRTNEAPGPLGVGRWFLIIAGCVLTLAFAAGIGYVTGGPWMAVALLGGVILVTTIGIVRAKGQKKRTAIP